MKEKTILLMSLIITLFVSLNAARNQTILQQVPKISLEFIAIFVLCTLIGVLFFLGQASSALTTLGLFAAAAFKLLPTVSRLIVSSSNLVFTKPVLELINKYLSEDTGNNALADFSDNKKYNAVEIQHNIKVEDLCFRHDKNSKSILRNINLEIKAGQSVGIIGESGSGKSTLINCLLGLLIPNSGKILIDDIKLDLEQSLTMEKNIGYVPQEIYLVDKSIRENIAFGIPKKNIVDERVEIAVDLAKLGGFIASLKNGLNTKVGERGVKISGGQRQRIGIARALYHDPQILILDEATSSLDNETEAEVMSSITGLYGSKTIIIVAHRISTLANCDQIYKMHEGKIIKSGHLNEVLNLINWYCNRDG